MTDRRTPNPSEESGLDRLFRAHRRLWTGVGVFILTFYIMAVTAPDPGLSWDEAIYIGFGAHYLNWAAGQDSGFEWQRLHQRGDEEMYGPVESHPPFGKAVTALSMWAFTGLSADPIMGARLGTSVCFALTATLLFFLVSGAYGLEAGALSALFLLLMPRAFGHGHLASLEVPLLLTWLLTVITFEKGTRNAFWSLGLGLCFGLALLTRFNAVLLPAILIPWGVLFRREKVVPNVVAMLVIAPLVFLAGWPAMWHNTLQSLQVYLGDKFGRDPVPFMYLGRLYPTADYPFTMALLTTPLPMLGAALAGVATLFKPWGKRDDAARGRPGVGFLLLLATLAPLALVALPGAPRYDGVRLFLPAFPFLAALAAIGALAVWDGLQESEHPRAAPWIAGAVLVWLVVPLVLLHPFQLAYYNLLVGGPWGADRLGMETVYWNESLNNRVLDDMQQRVPSGGKVALAGVGSQVDDVLRAAGWWPEGVGVTQFERHDWDALFVVPRKGWLQEKDKPVWDYRLNHRPVKTWYLSPLGKVPVCEVYERAPPMPGP